MELEGSTLDREEEGNSRQPSSLYWQFTFNNYQDHIKNGSIGFKDFVEKLNKDGLYVFQKEICPNTGTPHLQGYIKFHTKRRPNERYKYTTSNGKLAMRWFKSSKSFWNGGTGTGPSYCLKSESKDPADMQLYTNIDELDGDDECDEPYGWQLKVLEIVKGKPDYRKVYWFWEESGNKGKSSLCRFLCFRHDALVMGGKASDMKCMIAGMKVKPRICVMDIPRKVDHISYSGIEEIKNGCFASQKYESTMVRMKHPHMICFANKPPNLDGLSADRWEIYNIDDLISSLKVG